MKAGDTQTVPIAMLLICVETQLLSANLRVRPPELQLAGRARRNAAGHVDKIYKRDTSCW